MTEPTPRRLRAGLIRRTAPRRTSAAPNQARIRTYRPTGRRAARRRGIAVRAPGIAGTLHLPTGNPRRHRHRRERHPGQAGRLRPEAAQRQSNQPLKTESEKNRAGSFRSGSIFVYAGKLDAAGISQDIRHDAVDFILDVGSSRPYRGINRSRVRTVPRIAFPIAHVPVARIIGLGS